MVQMGRGSTETKTRDLGLHGYFFRSDDGKNIAQFRIDGFTFNRLKPYTSLDDILPLAMEMWRVYCDTAQPEVVTRLALRYINYIPLPPSLRNFNEYLRAAPPHPTRAAAESQWFPFTGYNSRIGTCPRCPCFSST